MLIAALVRVGSYGGIPSLPRIFSVMSADIDADAGYRVLSMSKNTTYFGLLSAVVAIILGIGLCTSDWVGFRSLNPILGRCVVYWIRKAKRGVTEGESESKILSLFSRSGPLFPTVFVPIWHHLTPNFLSKGISLVRVSTLPSIPL